jgi:hypothetical protein
VLSLTAPVATIPFVLGYATLARIGDEVRVTESAPEWTPLAATVDRFDARPGHKSRLFHMPLSVPESTIGAPVINDLNEVLGVVVATEPDDTSVIAVDALDVVLAEIGFERES